MNDPAHTPVIVAVNLNGEAVGTGWGKAQVIAIASVADGHVTSWSEHEVRWDIAHDEGTEGAHHARVVRFLRAHDVSAVVTGHMGAPMANMLGKMGVRTIVEAHGDARAAAVAAATQVAA